jgi:hypothetical protein
MIKTAELESVWLSPVDAFGIKRPIPAKLCQPDLSPVFAYSVLTYILLLEIQCCEDEH